MSIRVLRVPRATSDYSHRRVCRLPAKGLQRTAGTTFDFLTCSLHFLSPHTPGLGGPTSLLRVMLDSFSRQDLHNWSSRALTRSFLPPQERSPPSTSSVREVTAAGHVSPVRCCLGWEGGPGGVPSSPQPPNSALACSNGYWSLPSS